MSSRNNRLRPRQKKRRGEGTVREYAVYWESPEQINAQRKVGEKEYTGPGFMIVRPNDIMEIGRTVGREEAEQVARQQGLKLILGRPPS
jgi:hypothetical protein